MKIIKAGYEIWTDISDGGIQELKHLEKVARTCYKSEDRITEDGESAKKMIGMLIISGHEAMLEHGGMTVKFIVDRGVSHEIVRHRLFSFAQESTRYCNYSKDKFGNEIVVIAPPFVSDDLINEINTHGNWINLSKHNVDEDLWYQAMDYLETLYMDLLDEGRSPQEARAVLPNSLKTELVVTGNWREWRHFFKLRCDKAAHPQIREVACPLLNEMKEKIPVLFDDILY